MKALVLTLSLLCLFVSGLAWANPFFKRPLNSAWLQWKTQHGKTYAHPYHEARAHALWLRHWYLVQSHNSRDDVTFTLELNEFADQEFRRKPHAPKSRPLRNAPEVTKGGVRTVSPASFDWRKKGVVTPVKNQGQMGSADACAVTEDLESYHAINTGQLVSLSVTEVVDCCSGPYGRLVPDVYECIAQHGGLCSEASYPHTVSPHHVCRNDSCQAVAKDAKQTMHVPRGDEDAMVTAVLKRPLVVHVDASEASFQLYKAGVYDSPDCSHTVDHALQLVGYGLDQGLPYWILKNSWGPSWGNQGYIWLKRGVNMCGVADFVIYPQ